MKFTIRKIHTHRKEEPVIPVSAPVVAPIVVRPKTEERNLQIELEAGEVAKFCITTDYKGEIESFEYDISPVILDVLHYKDKIEYNHIDIMANNKTKQNVSLNIHYFARFK